MTHKRLQLLVISPVSTPFYNLLPADESNSKLSTGAPLLAFPSTMSPATDLPTLPVLNPTRSFWHTTHPNPLVHHRTTTNLPTRASVVIIGSGITGVFAARELIASGVTEVVVLEARDICSGATGRVSRLTQLLELFT